MWTPSLNFITLHYAYIISLSIVGLITLYPYGNMSAIDAYFFGASASTESGLNTVDLKELKTYQQLYLYVIPIISNLGFINIVVVVVRLHWFNKRFKEVAPTILKRNVCVLHDVEEGSGRQPDAVAKVTPIAKESTSDHESNPRNNVPETTEEIAMVRSVTTISFADPPQKGAHLEDLPRRQDDGDSLLETEKGRLRYDLQKRESLDKYFASSTEGSSRIVTRGRDHWLSLSSLRSMIASMFVFGAPGKHKRAKPEFVEAPTLSEQLSLPKLSSHATVGRNSQFINLTAEDREVLGGIEYRSLKLLLKIVVGYYVGLHLFGAICLVAWIRHANPKYRDYLQECGQDSVWWGFYSSQTMVVNLGFTLTPDSMIHFQDATFPLLVMSFLAYAGNTCYPCLLRFVIWVTYKLCPTNSSLKEPLDFLLKYPRRCYTLLFPSRPTWILFGILFAMNFIDTVLIIVLDLNNPTVNHLAAGPRVMAAIYQAASTRHTGTATFNLAEVNPAVQFSLMVMMYIAIYPIAISVRVSNTYEEKALGVYSSEMEMDEQDGRSYIMTHIRNQLTFDLWYIFLGVFCICIAEAGRIADNADPAFSIFSIFFEVVSAYGNVGLSLGYPTVSTSLSGRFKVFSKLVICAMMIRGRHRGLPYQLDRAIVLPNEKLEGEEVEEGEEEGEEGKAHDKSLSLSRKMMREMKRYHTH